MPPKVLVENGLLSNRYFNAGVMFINLKLWRELNFSRDLIANLVKYYDKIQYWDQDVLNITCSDRWQDLSKEMNVFNVTNKYHKKVEILHFTGSSKPWHFHNKHPYKIEYAYYRRLGPFYPYLQKDILNVISLNHICHRVLVILRVVAWWWRK
jgi:lipopolysaccharide biosynthesis glycosyltransferase